MYLIEEKLVITSSISFVPAIIVQCTMYILPKINAHTAESTT